MGNNNVVINWMSDALEFKGEQHAIPVRGVVDLFVRWFLGGTYRPRTNKNHWCRHIFCEINKAADTHVTWLMDNGDSGLGAQWMAPYLHDKMKKSRHIALFFDGARKKSGLGAAAWILWLRDEYGIFEKVSYGGRVLRDASAKIAELEALRMGIEHLSVSFPTKVSSFDFPIECTNRTIQFKFHAQTLRLFDLHRDVNDAHRAGANRLQNKTKNYKKKWWFHSNKQGSKRLQQEAGEKPHVFYSQKHNNGCTKFIFHMVELARFTEDSLSFRKSRRRYTKYWVNGSTRCVQYLASLFGKNFHEFSLFLLQIDRLQLMTVYCNRRSGVKTTPHKTRFRDRKVCSNWLQMQIDDHRKQSD